MTKSCRNLCDARVGRRLAQIPREFSFRLEPKASAGFWVRAENAACKARSSHSGQIQRQGHERYNGSSFVQVCTAA
jgi:hypothetical protein